MGISFICFHCINPFCVLLFQILTDRFLEVYIIVIFSAVPSILASDLFSISVVVSNVEIFAFVSRNISTPGTDLYRV